jgi:hypothetical protein
VNWNDTATYPVHRPHTHLAIRHGTRRFQCMSVHPCVLRQRNLSFLRRVQDVNNCFCSQEIKTAIDEHSTLDGGSLVGAAYGATCSRASFLYTQSEFVRAFAGSRPL